MYTSSRCIIRRRPWTYKSNPVHLINWNNKTQKRRISTTVLLKKITNLSAVTVSQGQTGIIGIIKRHIASVMLNIDISCSFYFNICYLLFTAHHYRPTAALKPHRLRLICLSAPYFKRSLHKRPQSLINSSFYILPPDFQVLSNKVLNVMKGL